MIKSDNEVEVVKKVMLLTDLLYFTRYFFKKQTGKQFLLSNHHRLLADTLHRVVRGEITRLIINIPPRYGKTELAVKAFVAWCLANNAAAKFIHLSYSDDIVLDNSAAIRDLIKSDEYQKYFPITLKNDSDSKKKWYTDCQGGLYATSAGGAITGFGAGVIGRDRLGTGSDADGFGGAIIIDDPLKPDDAFSDTKRGVINRRFNNTIASRLNSDETPIIVIMQRLHVEDMTGFLTTGGSGEEWHHVCVPAISEDDKALWPDKHSIEVLRRMEKASPYTFAGQYMQRPSPLGGGMIKGVHFTRYQQAPIITHRVIYADTAQKTKERNDYSVFECWGRGQDSKIYLLDMIRGKWEAPELERRAIAFWNKHKVEDVFKWGQLRKLKVEDKASGTGLIQSIKNKGQIPVEGIQRNTDKLTRVMDVLGYIESGYVCVPEDAPFTSDFISECEAFTADDSHLHDDQVDPMIDAINDMLVENNAVSIWERQS
jgi:predicted phage terminase large subunit-like protein